MTLYEKFAFLIYRDVYEELVLKPMREQAEKEKNEEKENVQPETTKIPNPAL